LSGMKTMERGVGSGIEGLVGERRAFTRVNQREGVRDGDGTVGR
jgi:hypothetical protein